MYIPSWFQEENTEVLHDLMQQFSFATLVTTVEGRPFATHLPFLLDASTGASGTLRAHMARPNPQWRHFEAGQEALVIFQGPHGYISPAWYEQHPSVPTWNYAVVHAYGVPRLLEDSALIPLLQAVVTQYEGGREDAWKLDLPEDYLAKMICGIVGFEIEITRLEGKFKLSQNRSLEDRSQVIHTLAESNAPASLELADWMRRTLPKSDG